MFANQKRNESGLSIPSKVPFSYESPDKIVLENSIVNVVFNFESNLNAFFSILLITFDSIVT